MMRRAALKILTIAPLLLAACASTSGPLPKDRVRTIAEMCRVGPDPEHSGALEVGVDHYYPPNLFNHPTGETQNVVGLDVDLIVQLRRRFCGDPNDKTAADHIRLFQVPFTDLFTQLRRHRFPIIIAGISTGEPLPGREDVIYSYPYMRSGLGLAVRSEDAQEVTKSLQQCLGRGGSGSIKTCLKELADSEIVTSAKRRPKRTKNEEAKLRVVVERQTVSERVAKDLGLLPVPSEPGREFALANEENVELVLNDSNVLQYELEHTIKGWTLLKQGEEPLMVLRDSASVVVGKGDTDLLWEINRVIYDLLAEGYIDQREERWKRYAGSLESGDVSVAVVKPTLAVNVRRELRTSKVDFGVQPVSFETVRGTGELRQVALNPSLAWLFPVDWPLLPFAKITDVGPQVAYVYKRKRDAGALGSDREEGWDLSAKFVLNSVVRPESLAWFKPEIALGAGSRHTTTEYNPGQTPPAAKASKVSVLGAAIPVMPSFHGLSVSVEYKHASSGGLFFGSKVDETVGLRVSYAYPH